MDSLVTEKNHLDGRPNIAPCQWKDHFKIFYLTEKMRSAKDPFFAELSDRVKLGKLIESDIDFFKSRMVPCQSEFSNDNFKHMDPEKFEEEVESRRVKDSIRNKGTKRKEDQRKADQKRKCTPERKALKRLSDKKRDIAPKRKAAKK